MTAGYPTPSAVIRLGGRRLKSAGDDDLWPAGPAWCATRPRPARQRADLPRLGPGSGPPDAHEQPRPGGRREPRRPRRLRRHRPGRPVMGGVRRDRPRASPTGRRRDAPRPVGQAGGRVPNPRVVAPGPDRQLEPRRQVGQLGRLPRARARGPDDVRPDDGRLVDLHRHPGDPPGHVRDVRRAGSPALRRDASRPGHPDRGPGRDGRRPAPGRDDERGCGPVHRGRRDPRPAPARDRLRRPPDPRSGRGPGAGPGRRGLRRRAVDRPGRQRGGDRARVGPCRRALRCRDRPDLGPRRPRRIRPGRDRLRRCGGPPLEPARRVHRPCDALDGRPLPGDARLPAGRCGRLRLRQQPSGDGPGGGRGRRVRLSGLRAGLHPAPLLRGQRAVPLGRPVGRSGRHPADRRCPGRALPRKGRPPSLAPDGPGEGALPGPAGPDLLAGLRRAGEGRSCLQRAGPDPAP